MASRGRGRGGWGNRGMSFGGAKTEPYVLFPEDVELPDINNVKEERALVYWNWKLQSYWKSSPYYLEEETSNKSQEMEIERYSNRGKEKSKAKRDPLSYHLKLTSDYFPLELIQGSKRTQHDQRKVRWNPEAGDQKLDFFEKLEQKSQNRDPNKKGVDEKKDGENEEDEEGIEEEDEEFSDDGDYNQNVDFDDDEDDFNMDVGDDDDGGVY